METASDNQKTTDNQILKCALQWLSESEGRKKCENDAGIISADNHFTTFYNDCFKPYYETRRSACNSMEGRCFSEEQMCKECRWNSEFCTVDSDISQYQNYIEIINGQNEYNCQDYKFSTNCDEKYMKYIAYQACKEYNIRICAQEYYNTHFKESGCYNINLCLSCSSYLKITLFFLIALFAF